jgi:hypothetical protein
MFSIELVCTAVRHHEEPNLQPESSARWRGHFKTAPLTIRDLGVTRLGLLVVIDGPLGPCQA